MMDIGVPVLRSLGATAVKRPLGTSTKTIDRACLLLIDLLTQDGIEGHAYAFCYQPSIARSLVPIVAELSEQLALQDSVQLTVDFNRALTFSHATQYALALDDEGIYWIEKPIRHDDYRHTARIADAARTPIQIGENFTGLAPMAAALEAGSSDYVMLDLDRIGGVTGSRRAAGLASAYDREVPLHLFPEGVRMLAATPGRHWLEYVYWADPILQEPLRIKDGLAIPSCSPGNGLAWKADVVAKYRLT
jgi:mandelate racemase